MNRRMFFGAVLAPFAAACNTADFVLSVGNHITEAIEVIVNGVAQGRVGAMKSAPFVLELRTRDQYRGGYYSSYGPEYSDAVVEARTVVSGLLSRTPKYISLRTDSHSTHVDFYRGDFQL